MAHSKVYSTWQSGEGVKLIIGQHVEKERFREHGVIVLNEVIHIPQGANDANCMRDRLHEARSRLFEKAKEYASNQDIPCIDRIRIESHSISANLIELVFYGNAMVYN